MLEKEMKMAVDSAPQTTHKKSAFKAQEEERARIAWELHDTVVQLLVSASYHSESSKIMISQSRLAEAIIEIDQTANITNQCIREIRRIMMNLSPGIDTMTIKELGRWESLEMVQRYARLVSKIE